MAARIAFVGLLVLGLATSTARGAPAEGVAYVNATLRSIGAAVSGVPTE